MTRKRRSFTPSFKAKVALEAVQETKTIAEIAQKHKLAPDADQPLEEAVARRC